MNIEAVGQQYGAQAQNMEMRFLAEPTNTGEIKSLTPGIAESFSFEPTETPDLVAVIQTFDGDAKKREDFTKRNGVPAGDQLALVDLRNAPIDPDTGAKLFMGQKLNPIVKFMLLGANADIANGKGYRGLKSGDSFTFGRFFGTEEQAKTDHKSRFESSPATSKNHFTITVDENDGVAISDAESSNGTRVITGDKMHEAMDSGLNAVESLSAMKKQRDLGAVSLHDNVSFGLIAEVPTASQNSWAAPVAARYEQVRPFRPDFQNALKVAHDELVRVAGNEGKLVSEKYLANQSAARELLVAELANGRLYQDKDSFKMTIQEAHKRSAADNVYQEVGAGNMKVDENNAGVIREEGTPTNRRKQAALKVSELSARYGDRYATRFGRLTPNTVSSSRVELSRVDQEYWPKDFVTADANGVADMSSYTFEYPDGESMDSYFTAMADIGKLIATEMNSANPDKNKTLALIAEQYQYGAVARPFDQINNSLFMNLANAQIKALGFNGITHGEMDLAAQRMQGNTFQYYFANRVKGLEA